MELVRNPRRIEADPRPALGPDAGDLSSVWFSLEPSEWTALALVPAYPGANLAPIASSLLDVAARATGTMPRFIDGRGLTAEALRERVAALEDASDEERRALVLLDSPLTCPPAQALVRRCDAALLCVGLGASQLEEAQRTLEACGRERFRGAIVVKEAQR